MNSPYVGRISISANFWRVWKRVPLCNMSYEPIMRLRLRSAQLHHLSDEHDN